MGQEGRVSTSCRAPRSAASVACMAHSWACDSSALCADPVCEAGPPCEEVADSSQCEGEGEGDEENPGQTPLRGSRGTAAPGHPFLSTRGHGQGGEAGLPAGASISLKWGFFPDVFPCCVKSQFPAAGSYRILCNGSHEG